MSRKPQSPDQRASQTATFNSLVTQLEQDDSLLNYLPKDVQIGALEIPEELLNLEETELVNALKEKYRYEPTNTVEALRNNFWIEYDRVQASRTENVMMMVNIYLGVCSREYFHRVCRKQPHILAYIITRSPEYEAAQAGLLSLSTRRIRDILSIPIMKNAREYQDPKLIELVLKAAAMVDLRNKGGYLNRSETKNLTVQTNKTEISYAVFDGASGKGKNAEELQGEINAKLKQLEEESRTALPLPKPKFAPSPEDEAIVAEYKDVSTSGEH